MPHFHCKLIAPRPTFPGDMTPEEGAIMQEHSAYLRGLLDKGTALVYGPVLDPNGPFGLVILEAADADAARRLTDADPVVKSNRGFRYEINAMRATARGAN